MLKKININWFLFVSFYLLLFISSFFIFKYKYIILSSATISQRTELTSLNDYTHKYGEVIEGEMVMHSFLMRNDTDTILTMNARVSCGCIKAVLSKESLKPGSTSTLSIWLDTTGEDGHVEQFADITTNDPQNKRFRLTVSANVVKEVSILPDRLWLGEAPRNATFEQEFTFSKRNDKKFDIKKVDVPVGVEYELGQKSVNNGITQIPVRFTINTGDSLGNYQRTIAVETERSKKKEHKIEISGVVLPDLKVIPPQINIPNAKPGDVVEKEIRVSPVKKTIASITAQAGNKNVAIGELRRDQEQYIVPVKITVPINATSMQDTIKVYYDGNKDTDILIPVRVNTVTAVTVN
jgi:hypothetical protein